MFWNKTIRFLLAVVFNFFVDRRTSNKLNIKEVDKINITQKTLRDA